MTARPLALSLSFAALALSCAHEAAAPPPNDPRFAMVTQAMDQQADAQDAQGLHDQANLTRKLAAQMRAGNFGSDPSAALGNAQLIEANAAVAREQKKSQPAPPPTSPVSVLGSASSQKPMRAGALIGRLAVLDLRNFARELTPQNATYFTDVIRQETLRSQPQLDVMTRENLLVLLQASGKKIEDCEGECEVDTGRRIGADLIVSGEIQKVGTRFKISLRLHETKTGRLLGSSIASGASVDELDDQAVHSARELYETAK